MCGYHKQPRHTWTWLPAPRFAAAHRLGTTGLSCQTRSKFHKLHLFFFFTLTKQKQKVINWSDFHWVFSPLLRVNMMYHIIFQPHAVVLDLDLCSGGRLDCGIIQWTTYSVFMCVCFCLVLLLYYCLTSPEPLLCLAALSIRLHCAESVYGCVCVCLRASRPTLV